MPEGTSAKPPEHLPSHGGSPRSWDKTGRLGTIFRSKDFEFSLPVAIALGALPAWLGAVANGAVPILITFGATLTAIAGLVIVAITVFVGVITPEYLVMIEQVQGGIRGAVRPYLLVVVVCMIGALASFAVALAWPAIPAHGSWGVALRWLTFSVSGLFTSWGLLGTIQVVALGGFHLEQRARLAEVLREVRRLRRPGGQ